MNIQGYRTKLKEFPDPVVRVKLLETIDYLDKLSAMTSTSIDSWNLIETFGVAADKFELVTDRGEINKRFFDRREALKQVQPTLIQDTKLVLDPAIKASIAKIVQERNKAAKRDLERRLEDREAHIEDWTAKIQQYAIEAWKVREQMEAISTNLGVEHVEKEIQKILDSPFWELWDVKKDAIEFATRGSLVMEQVNKAAKIDIKANIGRLRVAFRYSDLNVRVFPLHNNANPAWYHPHIYRDGRVCWGDAEGKVGKLLTKMEISEIFGILATILSQYNPASPISNIANYINYKPFNPEEPVSPLKLRGEGKLVAVKVYLCTSCHQNEETCECGEGDFNESEEWVSPEEVVLYG